MVFDDVVAMDKPKEDSQFRLKNCTCGSGEVVYLHCVDPFGHLEWKVKCTDCMRETLHTFPIKHDAQACWNTGLNVYDPQ